MRAFLPHYEMISPRNLEEALSFLHHEPGVWRPMAGGTDLMVSFEAGKLSHKKFLNICGLKDLQGITESADQITLGALTTYTQIRRSLSVQRSFPMLCQAAAETGAVAIQNRGTLGGNIVNASPAADTPPALMVYGAEVELISKTGARWIPLEKFYTGYKKTLMYEDELLSRVRIPKPEAAAVHFYRKVGTRKAQAVSKVCFAAIAKVSETRVDEVKIAMGSVTPNTVRCLGTEAAIRHREPSSAVAQEAREQLLLEISPVDDVRSVRVYRQKIAVNLLDEFLNSIS